MSERRLSEIAKVLRQPEGIVGSEFTRINKAARKAGIRFGLVAAGLLVASVRQERGRQVCVWRGRRRAVQLQADRQDLHRRHRVVPQGDTHTEPESHLDRPP